MFRSVIFLSAILAFLFTGLCSLPELHAQESGDCRDLPLTECPATGNSAYYVILFSGDGGWRELVRTVTEYLNSKDIPVLVVNTAHYFRSKKSPEQIAADLVIMIGTYNLIWGKSQVVLIGYSMGAEILPFGINRLQQNRLPFIKDLIMIAPWKHATFNLIFTDYIYARRGGDDILPELRKLKLKHAYCICDDSRVSLCRKGLDGVIDHTMLTGGHHFHFEYHSLLDLIGKRLKLE